MKYWSIHHELYLFYFNDLKSKHYTYHTKTATWSHTSASMMKIVHLPIVLNIKGSLFIQNKTVINVIVPVPMSLTIHKCRDEVTLLLLYSKLFYTNEKVLVRSIVYLYSTWALAYYWSAFRKYCANHAYVEMEHPLSPKCLIWWKWIKSHSWFYVVQLYKV